MDRLTTIIDGEIHFNIDNGLDESLLKYCNEFCTELSFKETNDCSTCPAYYCDIEITGCFIDLCTDIYVDDYEYVESCDIGGCLHNCKLPRIVRIELQRQSTAMKLLKKIPKVKK